MTLLTQEMLDRGYLAAGAFYPMLGHTESVVEAALAAADASMAGVRAALDAGPVAAALRGPVAHDGFRRLT